MKTWNKPMIFGLTIAQLGNYIRIAARSGICSFGDFR